MLKNRKFKMFGAIVLILAAILVTISAVNVPSPVSEDLSESSKQDVSDLSEQALVPVTGSQEGEASSVLELAANTDFTAEIKEEIRAGNEINSVENSYTAPEEVSGMLDEQHEFKILQWESSQDSR